MLRAPAHHCFAARRNWKRSRRRWLCDCSPTSPFMLDDPGRRLTRRRANTSLNLTKTTQGHVHVVLKLFRFSMAERGTMLFCITMPRRGPLMKPVFVSKARQSSAGTCAGSIIHSACLHGGQPGNRQREGRTVFICLCPEWLHGLDASDHGTKEQIEKEEEEAQRKKEIRQLERKARLFRQRSRSQHFMSHLSRQNRRCC